MPDSASNGPVIIHVFGRTDVGRTREHNEDAFVVADLSTGNATLQPEVRTHTLGPRGTLFMVADGMGGAAAGEIASAMAIEVVLKELTEAFKASAPDEDTFASSLKRAASAANAKIHGYALEHPEFRGMGTTATIAGVFGDGVYLAQVGDSRAYLVRDGVARQITKDQSLMQKLIEAGELTEEEAELSERRNIILQALGPESVIKVDLTRQQVRTGDTLVLCSDGLSGQVKIGEIADAVREEPELMAVCKRLIDRANENGGPDNITVIAARFEGGGLSKATNSDDVGHRVFSLSTDSGQTPASARTTQPHLANVAAAAAAGAEPSEPLDQRPTMPMPAVTEERELPFVTTAEISAKRRSTGSLISLVLLLILLGGAFWFIYQTGSSIVRKGAAAGQAKPTP